ncbi:MAG: imidazolonepropionase [Planctomycetes bacterium]|nr:imidazolonepropionase [Planctomycetota bacterium]
MASTLYINIGALATLDHAGEGPLIGADLGDWEAHAGLAVLSMNGRIQRVGPEAELKRSNPDARLYDCKGSLVTPGLIDAHTHPAFVKTRADEFQQRLQGASYEEILAAGGGIHHSVDALRAASDEELLAIVQRNLAWLRKHGVVACEGKSGYGLSLRDELRSLRAIRQASIESGVHVEGTCLAAHVVPKEYRERPEAYLDLVCDEILPQVAAEGLASAADIFVEENAFSGADLLRIAAAAKKAGLGLHVHADQLSAGEGARFAAELGALSADHLEYTTPEVAAALAQTKTCGVLLPGSTFVLNQSRWADGRMLVDAGVPIVLATDFNPGSSPVMNPAFIISLACMKLGLSAKEALAAFTRNAAYCLRIDDDFGQIATGRRTALTLWELSSVEEIPYWVAANLVRECVIEPFEPSESA